MAQNLWYILVIIVAFALIGPALNFLLNRLGKWVGKRREEKWIREHGNLIEWKRVNDKGKKFERIAAVIFRKSGYKTEVVGKPGDWGIDIKLKKDGQRYFAQCKNMEKVIPSDVRSFWGSIEPYVKKGKIKKGFLVTTGEFSKSEKEFVKDKPIELIDGLELEKMYKNNQ